MPEGFAPNFHWLVEDLAIGGSFPLGAADRLAREHGIGAVIDCREETSDDPAEMAACGLRFLHIPTADQAAVEQRHLDAGVGFARKAREDGLRLLVHCEQGIGRSATMALCVLVDRGMIPIEALRLAKDARPIVSPSPVQYQAWVAWMGRWTADAEIPDFESFQAIAYRHLAEQA